jgi:DNA-binding transcriptional regulator YhcF (GntR family)
MPSAMPATPRDAVFSFLKETKGMVNWSAREMMQTLRISRREAKQILPVLEMQGYVKKGKGSDEWLTTQAGETISGAKFPRYKQESIKKALAKFAEAIAASKGERESAFRVAKAVAFGDFLSGKPQVQAADVGLELEPRKPEEAGPDAERDFLEKLRPKSALIHVQRFAPWMERRTHTVLA